MDPRHVQPRRLRPLQPRVSAEQQLSISVWERLPGPDTAVPVHVGLGEHHHRRVHLVLSR